jgi:hypothetical protein
VAAAALVAACATLGACSGQDGARAAAIGARSAVVDSALPIEEALRRFRTGLPDTPSVFVPGRQSRDSLVRDFVRAVERRDSLELRRLAISRSEFAFLVYPTSAYVRPPYRQAPDIVWLQLEASSDKGLVRLLDRLGGRSLDFRGVECPSGPQAEGDHVLWRDCALRLGDSQPARLFGVIVERDGRFKFASYANDL